VSSRSDPVRTKWSDCSIGQPSSSSAPGRLKEREVSATYWPNSLWPLVSVSWTSSPSLRPECDFFPPRQRTRTTPTMRYRWRWWRSPSPIEVHAEDNAAVMKLRAKRHRDLASHRTQVACRLHAVLCELVPGGYSGEIYVSRAEKLLGELEPEGAVAAARHELAVELLTDLGRTDEQMRETKKRIARAIVASKTTLTDIFGVGPIVAAIVIGEVGDVARFTSSDRFAAYNGTAPIEVSSGPRKIYRLSMRGNRRLNHAIHMAAVTQIRSATAKGAPTTTARSAKERRARRPSERSSAASAMRSTDSFSSTPNRLEI